KLIPVFTYVENVDELKRSTVKLPASQTSSLLYSGSAAAATPSPPAAGAGTLLVNTHDVIYALPTAESRTTARRMAISLTSKLNFARPLTTLRQLGSVARPGAQFKRRKAVGSETSSPLRRSTMSTLRFLARPSSLSFDAIGRYSP